ncbi:MAG: hypothetical protein ABIU20_03035 [Blastocatellia bacterium]
MDEQVKTTAEQPPIQQTHQRPVVHWLKRLGWVGFLVFLIKGLLWLIIPALLAKSCM